MNRLYISLMALVLITSHQLGARAARVSMMEDQASAGEAYVEVFEAGAKNVTEMPISSSAKVGEIFSVQLPSNPATGYELDLIYQDPKVELVDSTYQTSNKGVIGGGGTAVFKFRALQPGFIQLGFVSRQAWEGGSVGNGYVVTAKIEGKAKKIKPSKKPQFMAVDRTVSVKAKKGKRRSSRKPMYQDQQITSYDEDSGMIVF